MAVMSAIGGENVTTTIEGRERYPVNVRYQRDYRSSVDKLNRTLISTMDGAQISVAQIADIKLLSGPGMIRDENGRLSGYVYVDIPGSQSALYVESAKKAIAEKMQLPPGYTLVWSGQYEYMQRIIQRLSIVVPVTIFIVFRALLQHTLRHQDSDCVPVGAFRRSEPSGYFTC